MLTISIADRSFGVRAKKRASHRLSDASLAQELACFDDLSLHNALELQLGTELNSLLPPATRPEKSSRRTASASASASASTSTSKAHVATSMYSNCEARPDHLNLKGLASIHNQPLTRTPPPAYKSLQSPPPTYFCWASEESSGRDSKHAATGMVEAALAAGWSARLKRRGDRKIAQAPATRFSATPLEPRGIDLDTALSNEKAVYSRPASCAKVFRGALQQTFTPAGGEGTASDKIASVNGQSRPSEAFPTSCTLTAHGGAMKRPSSSSGEGLVKQVRFEDEEKRRLWRESRRESGWKLSGSTPNASLTMASLPIRA